MELVTQYVFPADPHNGLTTGGIKLQVGAVKFSDRVNEHERVQPELVLVATTVYQPATLLVFKVKHPLPLNATGPDGPVTTNVTPA